MDGYPQQGTIFEYIAELEVYGIQITRITWKMYTELAVESLFLVIFHRVLFISPKSMSTAMVFSKKLISLVRITQV